MAGGSGDKHNLLSCVVLKTIETIETILKKTIFFYFSVVFSEQSFSFVFSETTLSFPKTAFVLRQLEHALNGLDGVACNVGRHIDGGPLMEKRVIHLLKGVHLHKLTLVA